MNLEREGSERLPVDEILVSDLEASEEKKDQRDRDASDKTEAS